MHENKYKIGLIIDNIYEVWAQRNWPSFVRNALKANISLYIFPGGRLSTYYDSEVLHNSVYSLANNENLDGLICRSVGLKDDKISEDDFIKFHSGFDPLPYVTLSNKIPGHPCVEFDGYTGMKQLVTHCIKVHGAKKIAFLCGPAAHNHVMDRLSGCEDALKEAGLPGIRDSVLVTDFFPWESGDKAAAQLFEERNLIPGRDFDTLVGSNDDMALKAINYFSDKGYHVPQDYRAIGFDNSVESQLTDSPLSTVMAPYDELSNECFQILSDLIDSKDSPDKKQIEDVLLPSKPIIRESCGCGELYYLLSKPKNSDFSLENEDKTLIARIAESLELNEKEVEVYVRPLIRTWRKIPPAGDPKTVIQPSEKIFFHHFEEAITKFFSAQKDPEVLFKLLKDILYSGNVPASKIRTFEPVMLWEIFKIRDRVVLLEQYKQENINTALNFLKFELLETRDKDSLIESLARYLPTIGIETAGLVLYVDDKTSRWVGGYSPEGIIPAKEQLFPVKLLVPADLKYLFSYGIFLVQSLFIEDKSIGYFIHTIPEYKGTIFGELRATISYALKGIFQFEEVVSAQRKVLESMEEGRILTLQKEAAQAASEAKSQFLANVSHEIRTPMNAILGMSELILSEKLNKRQKQYVEDIKTSAMALLDIINQILDLSKIQSYKMNLIPVHYDFKAMLDSIGSMVRFLIKNEDVTFSMDIHGDLPQYLYGDNVRLRQILLNILGNAVKFTKAGYVYFGIEINDAHISFTIKDTGFGIKEEDIPYLFEAFKQVDMVRNRDIKGTGLGLTITKALVEMMGGQIGVESIYGKGTTFNVLIPKVLGDGNKMHRSLSEGRAMCSPGTKILVVDDNLINLNVISGLLRLSNVTAFTATSGLMAIEMIQNNSYDLIFMDHMMPEMDGIEAMKIIRETGSKAPIIALTANAITSAKEMLLAAGMDDFLSKPIVKEELNGILMKWIPGSKFINSDTEKSWPVDRGHKESTDLLEKIGRIKGLSIHKGMESVSGQVDLYEGTLKLFVREIEKCIAKLNNFISLGDMHNFEIEAHSMKNSLANIGAMELSAKAYELETGSSRSDRDFCTSHLQFFLEELHGLGNRLMEVFNSMSLDKGTSALTPELIMILKKIKESMKEVKYEDINDGLINLEGLDLGGSLKDKIEEIKDLIIIMDYDKALEKINKLL